MAELDAIRVSGFEGLDAALGELSKGLEKAALVRAGKKALQPVAEEARRLAPVDEGDLRDSYVVATGPLTRELAREEVIDKGAVKVYVGTANRNGVPREFGSVRSPAQPHLRPAWEGNQDEVLNILAAELGPEVERTAARAAKRRGNGG